MCRPHQRCCQQREHCHQQREHCHHRYSCHHVRRLHGTAGHNKVNVAERISKASEDRPECPNRGWRRVCNTGMSSSWRACSGPSLEDFLTYIWHSLTIYVLPENTGLGYGGLTDISHIDKMCEEGMKARGFSVLSDIAIFNIWLSQLALTASTRTANNSLVDRTLRTRLVFLVGLWYTIRGLLNHKRPV